MKYWFGIIKPISREMIRQESLHRVAILVQEKIGDTIILTTLLKHMRVAFPKMEIILIGVRGANEILAHDPHINDLYNLRNISKQDKGALFSSQFDIIFNTKDHPSFTFLYLSRKILARYRIGIDHPLHRGFFHYLIPQQLDTAIVRKHCSFLEFLGVNEWEKDLRPYFPAGPISSEIKAFVEKTVKGKEVIGINLSADSPKRSWKLENYRKLIENIGQPVILLSMPDHLSCKKHLEDEFNHVISSPSTKTIFDAAYLIQHFRLFISPDTSLVHIASCYNTPVVILYTTSLDSRRFPSLSDNRRVLITPTENVDGITPQQIMEAYRSLWSEIIGDRIK